MYRRSAKIVPWLMLAMASSARAQAAPAAGPVPLPATADIYAQIDTGQYREALQAVVHILNLKGPAAAPYNRGEMYLLRAECQLQLHQNQPALEALDAAAKEARTALAGEIANPAPAPAPATMASATTAPGTQNSDIAGKAWALAALIGKSPVMHYSPKIHDGPVAPKPIDILDRTTRPDAYKSLFNDTLPDARAQVHAIDNATSMTPILNLAKSIAALRAMEQAGTGDTANSKLLEAALANRAVALLAPALIQMRQTAEGIGQSANVVYYIPVQQSNPLSGYTTLTQVPHRHGLANDENASLKTMQQTCAQIVSACLDLDLALENPDNLKASTTDANDLGRKITNILNDDYSRVP